MARARQGEVLVRIVGDADNLNRTLNSSEGRLGKFGNKARGAGRVAAAGLAVVGGAAVAAGGALFAMGSSFDKAYDTIRIGTGATGKQLEGLEDSFKNVVSNVPTDFDSASMAIADLNTRLGLTGEDLEKVAEGILEMSRMTGTDLSANIAASTRMFGDWSIATEDQADTLDELWRASQATGAGVDTLAQQVVQFGSPLRQMGFSLEESLAMFGRFEKEGVNIETVLAGMRMGLARMAKDGEEPAEALRRIMDEIKNAGSVADANVMAIEAFGQRAGPDMAAAIREGRFELDELMGVITDGEDTIAKAGEDTQSFGEKWTMLKNRVFVALEPVATRVFEAVGDAMDNLGPKVEQLVNWFRETIPPAIARVQEIWDEVWPQLKAGFEDVWAVVQEIWPDVQRIIESVMEGVMEVIELVTTAITVIWDNFGDDILGFVQRVWPRIRQVIEGALNVIRGIVQTITALIKGDWSAVWDGIKQILSGVWEAIQGVVGMGLEQLRLMISAGVEVVKSLFSGAWEAIKTKTGEAIDAVVGFIADLPTKAFTAFVTIMGWATSLGTAIKDGIIGGIGDLASAVWSLIKGAINQVIRAWNSLDFGIHIAVPSWVPGVGGKGFHIDDIIPDIPELATGAVITAPTLAVLGETSRARPEIVTPETLMADVFRRELASFGAGAPPVIVQGSVITERELESVVMEALRRYERRNGSVPVTTGGVR